MGLEWGDLNPMTWPGQVKRRFQKDIQPGGLFGESESAAAQRDALNTQGALAGRWADTSQLRYGDLGDENNRARGMLWDQATGKDSLSREQLRQGLQQQYAQQRSMAAGASPANSPMAARTAAINMGNASSGMSGQAAMAGIAERQAAQKALSDSILQQRQQELQAGLGSRSNAINAYKQAEPAEAVPGRVAGVVGPLIQGLAMSDRTAKTDIKDGDAKAKKILEGLKAYSYKYKDARDGKGDQFGPMAQDLEKDLGHTVVNTPRGKMVDGAKVALSSIGLTAALAKRVAKLEAGKK